MSDPVLFDVWSLPDGRKIGHVQLNAEKTLNSLSLEMIDLMAPRLNAWLEDDGIVAVFFDAAGDRAFSAGGDIQNLYHDMVEHPGGPCPYCEAFFEREYRLDHLIQTYPKPTIAWGHGIVMGGGLGLMSGCRYRIGTETTRIAMPEITIGLFPDAGATVSFSRMERHWSHFLAWTGANINGADAKVVGLVDHLLNHEQKTAFVDALKGMTGDIDTAISRIIADAESAAGEFPASQLLAHEALIRSVIDEAFSNDNPVLGFKEAATRLTGDKWLERAAASFWGGSPITAAIIPEQFRIAKDLSREEMFRLELIIAVQCARNPEFAEGVRALLIDKDGSPAWLHHMGEVPGSVVELFLTPPWDEHPMADLAPTA